VILSILIVTLQSRDKLFRELVGNLENQLMKFPPETVEILVACDNGEETTGAKRDYLLRRAMGDYCVSIDDDDTVPDYYISEIINAVKSNPDCVPIDGVYTRDGEHPIKWRMSKDNPNVTVWENGEQLFLRAVNHIGVCRTEIAKKVGFQNISNGEDKAFSEGIFPHLKTEVRINKQMYHYRFSSQNKTYK
jgi:hypothetical protein